MPADKIIAEQTVEHTIKERNSDESFVDAAYAKALHFLAERTKFGINLGLQRIEKLLALLGNPHRQGAPKYIHVGGTNGKGSVSIMLAEILQACGYKTGLFTSPHLHSYRERFRLNGQPLSKAELVHQLAIIQPLLDQMAAAGEEAPTEFEISTALALHYFTEQQADWAVIEVGMGGEIDSTNVIQPELAVITNVAMDHMAYLGETVAEIAAVKAGIIKPGVPTLTAAQNQAALAVLQKRAAVKDTSLEQLGRDFAYLPRKVAESGQIFDWQKLAVNNSDENNLVYADLSIQLLGEHQLANASLAVAAAAKLDLPEAAVRQGLAAARWPGRLEIVNRQPLTVLDGAHNVAGMQALSAALQQYWPGRPIVAVLGMLADKERAEALRLLLPLVSRAVITKVPSPRAGDWQALAEICQEFAVPCQLVESVPQAVAAGRQILQSDELNGEEPLFLVTGSLYMLAEARAYLLGIEQENY